MNRAEMSAVVVHTRETFLSPDTVSIFAEYIVHNRVTKRMPLEIMSCLEAQAARRTYVKLGNLHALGRALLLL